MRRIWTWLLVTVMTAGCLTGCAPEISPTTLPTAGQTQATTVPMPETALGHEDTYWLAYRYYNEDDVGRPDTLPTQDWFLDLTVRVDGTARFRDIHDGVCLMDDSSLTLRWERTPAGEYLFYSPVQTLPVLRGYCEGDQLTLDYWGTTLYMRQAEQPREVGQRYMPAELVGTWLLVSGETEGYQWEAMPNELSAIVFSVTAYEDLPELQADILEWDSFGHIRNEDCGKKVEVLQEPIYEGCENALWSVRLGAPSAKDHNGFPRETEFYATLTGENELLLQRYYTMDGYPAVSQQTYMRFTDVVSRINREDMKLSDSNWICTGYEDLSGESLPLPEEMKDFSLLLCSDGSSLVHLGGQTQSGTWALGNGGMLLLRGESFWLGGAVSGYWVETTAEPVETYQMALYYNGGIIKLILNSYG